jgi:hypothetical protein
VGVEPTQDCDAAPTVRAITLDLHSHVIPSMQRGAAAALDDVLAAGRSLSRNSNERGSLGEAGTSTMEGTGKARFVLFLLSKRMTVRREMTMANSMTAARRLGLRGVLAAVFAAAMFLALATAPASGALCITPDHGPGQSDTGDYVAEAPVAPEDFMDRGASMDNEAGKMAAWEAHFNSPAVEGPESCEELFD